MKIQTKINKTVRLTLALFLVASVIPSTAQAQGTAFTYQGRLNDSGVPANGTYDLRFAVFDAASAGNQAGPIRTDLGTGVTNGIFTVTNDFGGIFTGTNYWLDIGVRTNGAVTFVGLTPRQPLLPVPYAMFANTAANFSGTISNGSLPTSPTFSGTVTGGSFSGNGANLTSIDAGNISTGTLADARLSGNVALRAGGNTFTGTQIFDGQIRLDTTDGFSQSSAGNFYVDAPFIVGGRFTVLTNGNVGIGTSSPTQKLQVAGGLSVSGAANLSGALNLPSPATVNSGANRLLFSDTLQNFFAGQGAGSKNTNGSNNSGLGYEALFANTTGSFNTAVGDLAMGVNTTGSFNTGIGLFALGSNTNGTQNTAAGFEALAGVTSGSQNTAVGSESLFLNTNGNNNTAVGFGALFANTASGNTAVGVNALFNNTNGVSNVAVGDGTLSANTSGNYNTAIGHQALQNSTSFGGSTAAGSDALQLDTTGADNTAMGAGALATITTGGENIAVGNGAGLELSANSSENIDIGSVGNVNDQNTIRIGDTGIHHNTFVAGIYGSTADSGVSVFVDNTGHLGTLTSSARYKQNIRSMDDESDVLLSLRPVSFQYKPAYDPQGLPQFGLIAEEVENVDPDLVAHDANHGVYTVRYQAVSAMLLNEYLKQNGIIEAQNAEIHDMMESVADLKAMIEKSAGK